MQMIIEKQFYKGTKQPEIENAASLPVSLLTSMIMIDYAVHRANVPTEWSNLMAQKLNDKEEKSLKRVRAVLAHGWVLRDFLLKRYPLKSELHHNWNLFLTWLEQLSNEDIIDLIKEGIVSGLTYYQDHLAPNQAVEADLRTLGRKKPNKQTLNDANALKVGLNALLESWGETEKEFLSSIILDPSMFKKEIIELVKAIWEKGFKDEWQQDEKALLEQVAKNNVHNRLLKPIEQLILERTGLKPTIEAVAQLDAVEQIVFMPCLHLGNSFSIFLIDDTGYVLYQAQTKQEPIVNQNPSKSMIDLLELIGDKTRFQIIQLVKSQPGIHTIQIAETLSVHQSTISRHCQMLEKHGVFHIEKRESFKCFHLNEAILKELTNWMMEQFS